MEGAFIRYGFGVLLLLPTLRGLLRRRPSASLLRLSAVRGVAQSLGFVLWFYAMAHIPIADVTAIGYTSPILITLGAALFLGETLHLRRILAVLVGFFGMLVIVRPGFAEISLGQIAQMTATPLFATSFLLAKKLTDDEDPAMIVALLAVFSTLVLLPGAIYQWRPPTVAELAWLGLVAVFATAGQYALTRAFKVAPITVTQPANFVQLVFAVILGLVVFGDGLDPFVVLGAGIIVAAATYIAHREMLVARAKRRLAVAPLAAGDH